MFFLGVALWLEKQLERPESRDVMVDGSVVDDWRRYTASAAETLARYRSWFLRDEDPEEIVRPTERDTT